MRRLSIRSTGLASLLLNPLFSSHCANQKRYVVDLVALDLAKEARRYCLEAEDTSIVESCAYILLTGHVHEQVILNLS